MKERQEFANLITTAFPILKNYQKRFALTDIQRRKIAILVIARLEGKYGKKARAFVDVVIKEIVPGLEYKNLDALIDNVIFVHNKIGKILQNGKF